MKTYRTIIPALLLCLPAAAFADTFLLKDGTELEGTILRETEDSYVLEVQVTKSIKDERKIAKSDVERVRRSKPGEAEFGEIEALLPVPDRADAEEYADRIAQVEKYRKKFPKSPKDFEAKKIIEKLKKEANEVIAGGIKLNGRLIPGKEYRPNRYEVDARAQASLLEKLVSESQLLAALRVFDEMSEEFPNTDAYCKIAPLAERAARSHLAEVNNLIATFDKRANDRKVGLERMASADRTRTEAAIADQQAGFEKRFNAEKAAGIRWVTIDPNYKPSLDETSNYGKTVLKRIETIPSEPKVDAGKLYREAYSLSHGGGDSDAALQAIKAATSAGVGADYTSELEAAAAASGGN